MDCPVLIVEDDLDLREALVESLLDQGFCAKATDDGLEALRLLRDGRFRPTVIILDMQMPLMDGLTFLRHQDVEPWLRSIPVIVLSADRHHPAELAERTFAVLSKPVALDRLFLLIRQRCEASGHRH